MWWIFSDLIKLMFKFVKILYQSCIYALQLALKLHHIQSSKPFCGYYT
jgi:hypothetical protein